MIFSPKLWLPIRIPTVGLFHKESIMAAHPYPNCGIVPQKSSMRGLITLSKNWCRSASDLAFIDFSFTTS
ncbi:unnamed protein product [Coffea canephora]|uniref:Uncharacterized protein n=1 Tax=Coffea canephora TaxID=49390 RepID=A0A068TX39_COFCA|nr:unnamed protein product [Coffea canephora]